MPFFLYNVTIRVQIVVLVTLSFASTHLWTHSLFRPSHPKEQLLTKTLSASTIIELKTVIGKCTKAWVLSDRENSCHVPTKCGLSADVRYLGYLGIRLFPCHKPWCEQSRGLRHQTYLGSQKLKLKVLLAIKQHIYKIFQYIKPHRIDVRNTQCLHFSDQKVESLGLSDFLKYQIRYSKLHI